MVEHSLGKGEVESPILSFGTRRGLAVQSFISVTFWRSRYGTIRSGHSISDMPMRTNSRRPRFSRSVRVSRRYRSACQTGPLTVS